MQSPGHEVFTLLSVKHFESAVDYCTRLPIPINHQEALTTILLLRNSQFPRHFLNGCYLFLKHDASEQDIYALLSSLTPSHDHCLLKNIRSFSLFQTSVPPFVRFRVLGLPNRFNRLPGSWTSEGSTLVLSIRPSTLEQVRAGCKSYMSQLRSDAFIVDGGEYFASTYPAKKHLVDHECILAWMCIPDSAPGRIPAACIQYRFLEDELVPPFPVSAHALVTGIAVDEPFRRRGYGRALLLSVIASLPRRAELWVEVGEENEAAKGLYRSCGFVERWKQQSLCLRSVT